MNEPDRISEAESMPADDVGNEHTGGSGVHGGRQEEISELSGEFKDLEVESAFQRSIREKTIYQLRLVTIPAAVFYVLGSLVDATVIGENLPLVAGVATIRIVVAAAILGIMILADRHSLWGNALDRLIVISVSVVSIATWAIIPVVRGEVLLHSLTAIVLILIYYLFVPLRLVSALAISLGFTVGYVASIVLFLDIQTHRFIQLVLYLTLANILGALINRDRHTAVRREYLIVQSERRAANDLRAEIQRTAATERSLAESEARFRSLVELSPDAIMVHRSGRVLYLNPAGIKLMGASDSESVVGLSFFDFLPPDNRRRVAERMKKLEGGADTLPPTELRVRTVDGREVDCEVVSGSVLYGGQLSIQSVIRDINERKRMREELTRLATTDPLTGVANRRSFFDHLEQEWSRARRYTRALSILMFDLDLFKQVNDMHGHAVGDNVLQALVAEAAEILRADDLLARLGGEEFVILLPEIDLEGAAAVAERLRVALAGVEVQAPEATIRCTVSVGVAQARLAKESPDAALKRADDALYEAKRGGRNRVCLG